MTNNVNDKEHVWIYGAGFIGTEVAEKLIKRGVKIDGFVTSDGKGHFMQGLGLEIRGVDEVDTDDDNTLFIISVDRKHRQEIEGAIVLRGYHNIIFWEDIDISEYWLYYNYHFIDRRKHLNKVCFVLAGYKDFIWGNIFNRLTIFVPDDIEVCIISSGKYSEILDEYAKNNSWSYLYTDYNSVTFVQNIAMSVYKDAEYIYKMDEDMFLTKGCFESLYETYNYVESKEPFNVGFVAPLIPVNGYGHIRILDRLNKRTEYENKFDKVLFGCQPNQMLESNIDAAKYMWGYKNHIPYIDDLNRQFVAGDTRYGCCNVRFSIGFILFHRKLWEDMWGFPVSGNPDMGVDEEAICSYCMNKSYAIVVDEKSVVGHFSFGPQTAGMRDFYNNNPDCFIIR